MQDGQSRTEWRGSDQTQAKVSIDSGQYDFSVQAVRHHCSPIMAHITIPKLDNRGEQEQHSHSKQWKVKMQQFHLISWPTGFTVTLHLCPETLQVEKRLNSRPAGGFNLSWPELDSLATCGYTVEWCIQGNEVPCTLRWKKIQAANNTLYLPASKVFFYFSFFLVVSVSCFLHSLLHNLYFIGDFEPGYRYTFNIYGCKENVHRLLKVQTGYSQELRKCDWLICCTRKRACNNNVCACVCELI